MHRLFVALRPPSSMRTALLATMQGVAGARWQDDGQLHLTLRFIGEVDRHRAEDIAGVLATIGDYRPSISVEGVGLFAHRGRATSLWASVREDGEIERLRRAIDRALARVGVAPEHRAFRPHITLARLSRSAGPVERWIAETGGLRWAPVAITAFGLYESHLGSGGASYACIAEYALA